MKTIKGKLLGLWFVLTSRNFILIHGIQETEINGESAHRVKLLRRTDYSNKSDFLAMKLACIKEFYKSEDIPIEHQT